MSDFNSAKQNLVRHLQLTCQSDDGTIYWYEGTLESLWEFMKFAFFNYKEKPCTKN